MNGGDIPIDWLFAVLAEVGVGFGEWRTAKKAIMRGQWRGVSAGDYKMAIPFNFGAFFLCFTTP